MASFMEAFQPDGETGEPKWASSELGVRATSLEKGRTDEDSKRPPRETARAGRLSKPIGYTCYNSK